MNDPHVRIGPAPQYHVDHRGQPVGELRDYSIESMGIPARILSQPPEGVTALEIRITDEAMRKRMGWPPSDHAVDAIRYMIGPDGKVRPELAAAPTARDLGRRYPSGWAVIGTLIVVGLVVLFVVVRWWEATEGGR